MSQDPRRRRTLLEQCHKIPGWYGRCLLLHLQVEVGNCEHQREHRSVQPWRRRTLMKQCHNEQCELRPPGNWGKSTRTDLFSFPIFTRFVLLWITYMYTDYRTIMKIWKKLQDLSCFILHIKNNHPGTETFFFILNSHWECGITTVFLFSAALLFLIPHLHFLISTIALSCADTIIWYNSKGNILRF